MNAVKYGSWATGIGLAGLALYQFSTADLTGAVQSVLAALAAFGVGVNSQRHEELTLKLQRRGFVRPDGESG